MVQMAPIMANIMTFLKLFVITKTFRRISMKLEEGLSTKTIKKIRSLNVNRSITKKSNF